MLTKDIYGLTVNTDKCYELQVQICYIEKLWWGNKIKRSKEWIHWNYYKTMTGMLAALRFFKTQNYNTLKHKWKFRPAHKYYNIDK